MEPTTKKYLIEQSVILIICLILIFSVFLIRHFGGSPSQPPPSKVYNELNPCEDITIPPTWNVSCGITNGIVTVINGEKLNDTLTFQSMRTDDNNWLVVINNNTVSAEHKRNAQILTAFLNQILSN